MKQLTLDLLKHYSTAKSFSKGMDYYDSGLVKKVVKQGNQYQAIVWGSTEYEVTIVQDELDWHFFCTCPYDWGGICKHCVAVGMSILNKEFEDKTPKKSNKKSSDVQQFLTQIYEPADARKKEAFLKELLIKNEDLRNQFAAYVSQVSAAKVSVDINKICKEVHEKFKTLDFTEIDDFSSYDDYGYYRDEWEVYYENAEEMVSSVFNYYFNQIREYLQQGDLANALTLLLGVYEGIYNVYYSENDEYDIVFDSYNELLLANFDELIQRFIKASKESIIKKELLTNAIDLFFDRVAFYRNEQKGEKEDQVQYELSIFQSLLLYLIDSKELAQQAFDYLTGLKLWEEPVGNLGLKIARLLEDESLWIRIAEKHLLEDKKIALQLIEKYREKKKYDDELRILREAFGEWPNHFDHYITENYNEKFDMELYKKAYANYCKRSGSLNVYKKLRKLLNEQEKNDFIESCKEDETFYARLLAAEKRFEEIFQMAKKARDFLSLKEFVHLILHIYPDDCVKLIRGKVDRALIEGRGRPLYRQIVEVLKELRNIPGKEMETTVYLQDLYKRKPILPALREEMKKAGLV